MAAPKSNAASSLNKSTRVAALLCALLCLQSPCVFAADPKAKPAKVVEDKDKEEAAAISQIAAAKNQASDFGLCAELYQQAYHKDPSFLGYLFSAARCEQKAGDLDAAERDFRLFLARNPKGDKLSEKAQQFLDEILEERKKAPLPKKDVKDPKDPVVQQVVPIEPVKPVVVVAPAGPSHAAAWGATIGGGALVIAGGILTWTGFGMKNDLTARLAHPADALILNTSPTEARADESAYRTRIVAGAGVAAIGVVAVGLGYWLFGSDSKSVTVAPAPNGVSIQFAWR